MNEYSIPKPTYPIYLRLLAGLVTAGLFGLGLVSYHTFNQVHGPFVAAIYAAIIEVGAALDAIGLAGGINRRSWWLIPAMLLTVIGSGWYNYAAVAHSGATWGIIDPGELTVIRYAIAWLPLASLSFMALGLGFKISDHEAALTQWAANRQAWQDNQAVKTEAARVEARRLELESKEKTRLAEIKAKEREAKRQERREARAARVEASGQRVEAAAALPGTSIQTSENFQELPRGSFEDFRELLRANHHEYKNADLARRFHVSTRTITEWRKRYQESHPAPQPEIN